MSQQSQSSFISYYQGKDFSASAGLVSPLNEFDPTYELSQIEQAACEIVKQSLIHRKFVTRPEEVMVRTLCINDESGLLGGSLAPLTDLDIKSTAQRAGLGRMSQDNTDFTADDLSAILKASETVDAQKAIAVYGFIDFTPEPDRDLIALRFKRGSSDVLGFFPVQHCYVGKGPHGGIFGEPKPVFDPSGRGVIDVEFVPFIMLWEADEKINVEACVATATDKMITLLAVIAEKVGTNISQTGSKR